MSTTLTKRTSSTKRRPAAKKSTAKQKTGGKRAAKKPVARPPQNAKSKLYASLTVQLLSLLKGEHDLDEAPTFKTDASHEAIDRKAKDSY